jgi:membrane-associated protease RseP (regulator of RpoE activity)
MLVKEISESGQDTKITSFSDYRNVGGITRAFRWDVETKPINNPYSITWTHITTPEQLDMNIFAPPSQDAVDFEFVTDADSVEIPFQYIGRHIYITARVGESIGTWLLDSGAQMSCIEPDFAEGMDLEVIGKIKVGGADKEVDAAFVAVPEFFLSQLKLKDQKVLALSITNLIRRIAGVEVSGILGFDFLSRFVTKIDYQKQRITFYKSDHFQYTGTGDVIDAPLKNGTFTVPMHVDNKYSGIFRIDLGAGGLAFHYPFARQNKMHGRKCIELLSSGAGGHSVSMFSRFDQLQIGTYELKKPIISFPKEEAKGSFGDEDIIGNIGNALLENFTIVLDYERQQFILEKSPLKTPPFSFDRSGMQIQLNENEKVEIFHIIKGGPAEKAGLKTGDILTHINGIECSYLKEFSSIAKLFKAEAGTEYRLTIVRDKTAEDKKITLKELL